MDLTGIPLPEIWHELERRFPFGICVGWAEAMPDSPDVVVDVRLTGDGGMALLIVDYMKDELERVKYGTGH